MQQDVGIAEQEKVKKQGRDNHIKQCIQPPTYLLLLYTCIMEKVPVGGCILTVLCDYPYLVS